MEYAEHVLIVYFIASAIQHSMRWFIRLLPFVCLCALYSYGCSFQ